MKFPNRILHLRQQLEISRDELARIVGITRQAVGLIEAGKVSPSTLVGLRIARTFGVPVEALFDDPEAESLATIVSPTDASQGTPGKQPQDSPQRAFLGSVNGSLLARPVRSSATSNLTRPAHALVSPLTGTSATGRVSWLQSHREASGTVFISGCDAGLGLLAEYMSKSNHGVEGIWFELPNRAALQELKMGQTHVAAIHEVSRVDGLRSATGLYERAPGSDPVCILTFAEAEIGWMVRDRQNAKFAGPESLGGHRLRVVNRPVGAGVRTVLDKLLQEADILPAEVDGYNIEVRGHLAVAQAVAEGLADVGLGHAGAAALFGLDFIPVQRETCSLVIPRGYLEQKGVQALLQTLQSDRFRGELCRFGPYEVQDTGATQA